MILEGNSIDDFYTPLEEVATANISLPASSAARALGIPEGRYAVFPRQLASPTHEVFRFLTLSVSAGLTPLFLEFHSDKFVTRNRTKFSLARMTFTDTPCNTRIHTFTTLDIQAAQGRSLRSLRTHWGEPFVNFHHSLFRSAASTVAAGAVFYDASRWFHTWGPTPQDYYFHFLSLFLSDFVLFESYVPHSYERSFTTNIVIPAFQAVKRTFGHRPRIVRLDPPESEGTDFWQFYPTRFKSVVDSHITSYSPHDQTA